jgi:hypothetical protein
VTTKFEKVPGIKNLSEPSLSNESIHTPQHSPALFVLPQQAAEVAITELKHLSDLSIDI